MKGDNSDVGRVNVCLGGDYFPNSRQTGEKIPHPVPKFWRVPLPERQPSPRCCQDINRLPNRPFPSSLVPLFRNESKCGTFHMKMSSACNFIFMQIKVIFIRGFALRLALKQRHKGTRKWPILAPCFGQIPESENTPLGRYLTSDKNSHFFQHICGSDTCRALCLENCFSNLWRRLYVFSTENQGGLNIR